MRVLIVDDDPSATKSLARTLRQFHHEVISASNGKQGLEMMHTEHPDLVVLDLIFPPGEMQGKEIKDEKEWDPDIRGIPVIIITGMSKEQATVGAKAAKRTMVGTTFIMTKPVDEHALALALMLLSDGASRGDTAPPDHAETDVAHA